MAKTKIRAKAKKKTPPAPSVQKQPETPEKEGGPLPATRATELVTTPEQSVAAPSRARLMSDVQRSVGNARLSRLAGTAMQAKLKVGAPHDHDEQEADRASRSVMRQPEEEEKADQSQTAVLQRQPMDQEAEEPIRRQAGQEQNREPESTALTGRQVGQDLQTSIIQRQPTQTAAPAQAPASNIDQAILDQVVGQSIVQTLRSFQNIPIQVTELVPPPAGQAGPPQQITKTIHIHAVYFINRSAARYARRRRAARFSAIKRALRERGAVSTIRSSRGRELAAGRAVEVGKGTPEDIKMFVEEAINQGIVRRFAIRRRVINRNQRLVDLDEGPLQELVQRWVRRVRIGVDCSGFVLQAAIRAREAERAAISMANFVGGLFGAPPQQLPPERSHDIRSAASFRREPRVRRPTELRPGDAWVVRGGGHIRIVTAVRETTSPSGRAVIEFDTAESAGTSRRPTPGPVARTWQTRSRRRFHPARPIGHRARPRGGTFHRIR